QAIHKAAPGPITHHGARVNASPPPMMTVTMKTSLEAMSRCPMLRACLFEAVGNGGNPDAPVAQKGVGRADPHEFLFRRCKEKIRVVGPGGTHALTAASNRRLMTKYPSRGVLAWSTVYMTF